MMMKRAVLFLLLATALGLLSPLAYHFAEWAGQLCMVAVIILGLISLYYGFTKHGYPGTALAKNRK